MLCRLVAILACGAAFTVPALGATVRPHVFLIVIDGFDPRHATAERLPTVLGEGLAGERRVWWSHTSMPTVTNTNHVTLCTGVEPDGHGITGNAYWNPADGADRTKLDDAALIETETIFTVAERVRPESRTMAVLGKPKLGRLFSAVPARQSAADVAWDPDHEAGALRDARTGYAPDDAVMTALLARLEATAPDFVLVNLPDVDRISHGDGPDHPTVADALRRADHAIGRLVNELQTRGWWNDTMVLITGDHGFDNVAPTAETPHPAVTIAEALRKSGATDVAVAADGGVAHVYPTHSATASEDLPRAAKLARTIAGVERVYARVPVAGVEPLPPDWHLDHPRAGDLLLVAARGHQLVRSITSDEAQLRGNHGSPRERLVPLVILGGHPLVRSLAPASEVRHADIGVSLFRWLDLPDPRQLTTRPLPAGSRGQPISGPGLP